MFGIGDYRPLLNSVFNEQFEEDCWPVLYAQIMAGWKDYKTAIDLNQERRVALEQRADRRELIESLKEVLTRLFLWHIPMPLRTEARARYKPLETGEQTLDKEIADIVPRLGHLMQLFDSIEIPKPNRTNPGKPERDEFIRALVRLHGEFSSDAPSSGEDPAVWASDQSEGKRQFIDGVLGVLGLEPLPKSFPL